MKVRLGMSEPLVKTALAGYACRAEEAVPRREARPEPEREMNSDLDFQPAPLDHDRLQSARRVRGLQSVSVGLLVLATAAGVRLGLGAPTVSPVSPAAIAARYGSPPPGPVVAPQVVVAATPPAEVLAAPPTAAPDTPRAETPAALPAVAALAPPAAVATASPAGTTAAPSPKAAVTPAPQTAAAPQPEAAMASVGHSSHDVPDHQAGHATGTSVRSARGGGHD
jgi:hypothetical protein